MQEKTSKPSAERLGRAVRDRRKELRLSREQAAKLSKSVDPDRERRTFAGLSPKTWSNLELGLTKRPYPHTLRVVDATLGWPDGTARAHWCGSPLPAADAPAPEVVLGEVSSLLVEIARLQLERALLVDELSRRKPVAPGVRLPA